MGSSTSFHETSGETFTKWTRIIRTVELYLDKYLVGREFPPDVRLFKDQLVEATSMIEVQQLIIEVRQNNAYAAEAYSFNLSDTTGEFPDILFGSIPESKTGVTGDCILALMLEVEALKHNIPLTGHCTDSAANALKALLKLASPNTFIGLLPEIISLVYLSVTFAFCPLVTFISINSISMLGPFQQDSSKKPHE